MNDPFNLARFIEAQEDDYAAVLGELKRGKKTGHWIWYIFPQIAELGFSEVSQYFSISSIDEANAYLDHAELGPRLIECVELVNTIQGKSAEEIFGSLDAMKFRSSMTLFLNSNSDYDVFRRALDMYFDGRPDPLTVQALIDAS